MAEDETLANCDPSKLDFIKKAAIPLARAGLKAGLAWATVGLTNHLGDALDAVVNEVGDNARSAVDDFWKQESGRLAAMQQFRTALEGLTKTENGAPQKIVFIIDELDRCRPDYALSLLEIIKHFFTVPNVHFVLGVNLRALAHSVEARYGVGIGGAKYLQKFVSLTMRLPTTRITFDPVDNAATLYLERIKASHAVEKIHERWLNEYFQVLGANEAITLRDIQRILSIVSFFPKLGGHESGAVSHVLVGVAILAVLNPNIYRKLRKGTASFDEVVSALSLSPEGGDDRVSPWQLFAVAFKSEIELSAITGNDAKLAYANEWLPLPRHLTRRQWMDKEMHRYFDTFTLPPA